MSQFDTLLESVDEDSVDEQLGAALAAAIEGIVEGANGAELADEHLYRA